MDKKRTLLLGLLSCLLWSGCENLSLEDVLATGGSGVGSSQLTTNTIAAGLKEALEVGSERVVTNLGVTNGFYESPNFRIPLPESLSKIQNAANQFGMGSYFNDLELKMNRAAEQATPKAKKLFVDAIRQMSFADVMNIYRGPDDAATAYLRSSTEKKLKRQMAPLITNSLNQVGAVKTFNTLVSQYNQLPLVKDVDADMSGHVLNYANNAIFAELADQEAQIRRDPVKRTTELLRRVFSSQ